LLNKDQFAPGLMDLNKFQPSNFYARAPNVSYTIWVKPSHDLGTSARVVVTIPANIIFDKDKPCFIGGIPGATCEVT